MKNNETKMTADDVVKTLEAEGWKVEVDTGIQAEVSEVGILIRNGQKIAATKHGAVMWGESDGEGFDAFIQRGNDDPIRIAAENEQELKDRLAVAVPGGDA